MVKWQGREESSNIEDRRGQGGIGGGGGLGGGFNPGGFGGGGFRLPSGRSGMSMGGIAVLVVFVLIAMAFGINPIDLLTGSDTSQSSSASTQTTLPPQNATEDDLRQFVGVVVKDTETFWTGYFQQHGGTYTDPKVVLYSGQTQSGCGTADSSAGPFYCPVDQKVYIDLSFYQQLRDQFGAPGDFAQAYVIAHEVGHHVQDLLGILPAFNKARQTLTQDQANAYSVKIELQADCFAGMWGQGEFKQGYLDDGDVQEAINAANQIGDDTLSQNTISPRQYTHGSSAQRMQWFKTGYQATDVHQCDTGLPAY
ncbi:MAG TPA: neutral zinc metallopeptidase [Devosia sp.]|nr:neutral zinc metallopeptidase [Devosia sp.]